MWFNLVKVLISAAILVTVSEIAQRLPKLGGLLLSLPLVSILAFLLAWHRDRDLPAVSRLARETLILVPLGLPFFVPLAFADRLGLGFWSAAAAGMIAASGTIGCYLTLSSQ